MSWFLKSITSGTWHYNINSNRRHIYCVLITCSLKKYTVKISIHSSLQTPLELYFTHNMHAATKCIGTKRTNNAWRILLLRTSSLFNEGKNKIISQSKFFINPTPCYLGSNLGLEASLLILSVFSSSLPWTLRNASGFIGSHED